MRSLTVALLVASLGLASLPTFAASLAEEKNAAALQAMKDKDFERALKILREIPPGERTVFVRLRITTCLVRLGKFREAEELLTELVKDPAAEAVRETAQSDLDDLRARLPKLTVRLATGSPADVWVTVDGVHVGPPVTIPLDPGTHNILATRNGKDVFKQKVTLQDSQTLEVEIDTSIVPPEAPVAHVSVPATPAPAKHDEVAPEKSNQKTWGWIAIGAGGAFGALALVSHLQSNSAADDYRTTCQSDPTYLRACPEDGKSKVRTWETLRWTSGVAAVIGIGVGVTLLVTAPKDGFAVKAQTGSVHGLVLEGSF
jgi:hypothetical protein